MAQRRRSTATSGFGVSRREGHDARGFYTRFAPPHLSEEAEINPPAERDQIFCGDARRMEHVQERSVALVVTSPPYFAGKEYEQDVGARHIPSSYLEYLSMLEDVLAECARKLEPGGRIAVNVANLGRKPYRSLSADLIGILQDRLGLLLRGEIIWQKALGATGSCAWGSFQRPSNPVVRDLTERVILAGKGRFSRALNQAQRKAAGLPWESSLTKDEFLEATTDVWQIPSESANRIGHPAPFPVALPERLIHLYTYAGDLVLDPFMGSGSSAVAAVRTGRHFIGYETDSRYVALAQARVAAERERPQPALDASDVPASSAKESARCLLLDCGFGSLRPDATLAPGLQVSFSAEDATGQPWLFDVAGAFTTSGSVLKRADILWKALGKAAVLHQVRPDLPLVLLTTEAPAATSPAGVAVASLCGPGKPILAVAELGNQADRLALQALASLRPPLS